MRALVIDLGRAATCRGASRGCVSKPLWWAGRYSRIGRDGEVEDEVAAAVVVLQVVDDLDDVATFLPGAGLNTMLRAHPVTSHGRAGPNG